MLRPPYDPLLQPAVEASNDSLPELLDVDSLRRMANVCTADSVFKIVPDLDHKEYSVPGLAASDSPITLSVFENKSTASNSRPALYFIHSGGQVAGNRFASLGTIISYFDSMDVVYVSVEYRLAPEHRAPAALHDCYAGLLWTVEHATELGIDTSRIIVCGRSGGGPMAVGTTMLCRNEKKPYPLAQMILTPMLDDRNITISSKQFARDGPWCGAMNRTAWGHVLGSVCGGPNVSELVAPARATDLSGLPPTFLDAAECEVFRDETVAFASQLWKSGVTTELHIWPGAYHGFDKQEWGAPVAFAARDAKMKWIKRILGAFNKDSSNGTVL